MIELPTLRYVFFHEEPAPANIAEDDDLGVDPQAFWRDSFSDTVGHLLQNAAGDEITPEVVDTNHPVDLLLRLLCEMPHIVKQGFNGEDTPPDPEPAEMFQQQIEDSNLAYNLGMSLRVGMGQVHNKLLIKDALKRLQTAVEAIDPGPEPSAAS